MKFKKGDKVIVTKASIICLNPNDNECCNKFVGKIGTFRYEKGGKACIDNFSGTTKYCSGFDIKDVIFAKKEHKKTKKLIKCIKCHKKITKTSKYIKICLNKYPYYIWEEGWSI